MIDCMINLEDLYSEVPPTKLRNIDEKFRPAQTSPFWFHNLYNEKHRTGFLRDVRKPVLCFSL